MKHVAFFLFVLGAFASVCNAQIRINEILADPASDWSGDASLSSKDDEWVEVINAGATVVDLSAYRLGDASGGTTTWRFGFAGTLAPGAAGSPRSSTSRAKASRKARLLSNAAVSTRERSSCLRVNRRAARWDVVRASWA